MLSALHAEFQKAHRRHDLAICLVVPVVVFLWTGRLTSNDPEELANAYSALLYAPAGAQRDFDAGGHGTAGKPVVGY